ncbi:sepiapterin reductase-like isoform X1 [Osmerus mordax]|uniref:sepiapterin reductase-like isoform X1 n=1 Tax=Osmerus mordax TaxID=8014 RepID=UPI00350E9747
MQTNVMSDMIELNGKDLGRALCIITGASKGFGRTIAKEIPRFLKQRSVLVLAARSADHLRDVQAELAASEANKFGLVTRCVVADLAMKEGVESVISAAKKVSSEDMDHLILVNNAASLGNVSRYAQTFTNIAEVDSYLSFNISSALSLTAGVLQAFPKSPSLRRSVVNISSLCALQPIPSWVLYCTGKAARDMMFRVLAEEEPDLRVLNYAPGKLERVQTLIHHGGKLPSEHPLIYLQKMEPTFRKCSGTAVEPHRPAELSSKRACPVQELSSGIA